MRYSLFQIFVAVLVIALSVALFVNQRRFRSQVRAHEEEAVRRERLQDSLERTLLDELKQDVSLDEYPYYRILVDDILTVADPGFEFWSSVVGEMTGESPSTYTDCELHFFYYKASADTSIDVVIVRNNQCVGVVWVGANIAPR